MNNRTIVALSNPIINFKGKLTSNAIDILMLVITAHTKEDTVMRAVEFTVLDLEERTGRRWSKAQIKDTLASLNNYSLYLMDNNNWIEFGWIHRNTFKDGVYSCQLHEDLTPYILELANNNKKVIDIKYILSIKSSYSKRIYLLCKQLQNFGTRIFILDELRELLQTPKSMEHLGNLKKNVLDIAIQEINKSTDIQLKYTTHTTRKRTVTAIKMSIKTNIDNLDGLKTYIRDLYPNKHIATLGSDKVAYTAKGVLYYLNSVRVIDKNEANRIWDKLYTIRQNIIKKLGER